MRSLNHSLSRVPLICLRNAALQHNRTTAKSPPTHSKVPGLIMELPAKDIMVLVRISLSAPNDTEVWPTS